MNPIANDILMHYGMPRRSGRYPWGSGENPYQRTGDFLARYNELKDQNMSEVEIANAMGLSTTQLRVQKSRAKDERRMLQISQMKALKEKGYNRSEIARQMGVNESTIRSWENEESEARMNAAKVTAQQIEDRIKEVGMVDVGEGVERELGVSKEKLEEALYMLELKGYPVYGGRVPQATNPGQFTTLKVICPPGTEHKEIFEYEKIHSMKVYSPDDGETFYQLEPPTSFDSKRLDIRYGEEGGNDMDGVIELRRGVKDISLGDSSYAQVRIMVDGTHYMKGMAVYSDDLPDGIDIRFNTNKPKGTPVLGGKDASVLKPIKDDPMNPFGALIKADGQTHYDGPNGEKLLSPINKTREEGEWMEWSHDLPAQFLSKQDKTLISKQIRLSEADKEAEFNDILKLTNPTVKRVLLQSFADDCDAASVHLKAAALPRQSYQVILPVTDIPDDQVYAPNYNPGEKVALIRFPHGGTFEIPILTVNNDISSARSRYGQNAKDMVGINKKVADRLSGADFDGDTVMVIPISSKANITSKNPLKGLEDFDPKMAYPEKKGMKYMTKEQTQKEMGVISNLITDMTLKGAPDHELAKAVKHSMVVIDAEKHKLNYKQSEIDNGIAALKRRWQGHYDEDGSYHEGASTLISAAKSEVRVDKRVGSPKVNIKGKPWYDPEQPEGALLYKSVKEYYTDKNGKVQQRVTKTTKMAEAKDAHSLSSGTVKEELYADYANYMKDLANRARKEMIETPRLKYSASAKETYKEEVAHLTAQLLVAEKNKPRERQAQTIAAGIIKAKKQDDPSLKDDKKALKKVSQQALTDARLRVGAKRHPIEISEKEWEAIQAGAISDSQLLKILNHTNTDTIRKYATPRQQTSLSQAQINRINAMAASGYSTGEIAEATGVSTTTIRNLWKKEEN